MRKREPLMLLDVQDLNTYDNRAAAALAAFALSEAEAEMLEAFEHYAFHFSGISQAFDGLGKIFHVKRNTIKNYCDAFDPHTSSNRKGWHKAESFRPAFLEDIFKYGQTLNRQDLIDTVIELSDKLWLPDLNMIWKECERDLSTISTSSELEVPRAIIDRIVSFLHKKGLGVTHVGRTAIAVTSIQKGAESILSFAYLPKFKAIMPFVDALLEHKRLADDIQTDLLDAFPNVASAKDPKQKMVTDIRSGDVTYEKFYTAVQGYVGSDPSVRLFYDAITTHFPKAIFRNDVITPACSLKLNLENEKTGYVDLIVDYLISSRDKMDELQLPTQLATIDGQTLSLPDNVPRNVLYFGAPGTGKSHNAEHYVDCRTDYFYRTVFFADYQNADFVGTVKPAMEGNDVSYRFEAGPLVNALKDAFANPTTNVVLLIEEINRGNAPAIFGEMFQLLDRDKDGSSKYSITVSESLQKCLGKPHSDPVRFPSNLFIVATMNAGDQGVFALDTAFKRRWHFEYMQIDFDTHLGKEGFSDPKIQLADKKYSWAVFAKTVNEVLVGEVQVPEDRLLGPFFLSPTELDAEDLTETVAGKVLPYLWEDVLRYDDRTLLFDNNISSFAQLQNGLKAGEQVFSDKFNSRLSNMVSQSNPPQETPDAQNEVGESEEETPRGAALDETSQ